LLLGEAGLGKSWEVERFAGAAGDRRLVRLGGVGPDAYAAIRTREWFAPWRDGADELTLVLDGLNEAPGGAPKALLDLLDDLPAGARRRLGLVLTCRTAAAPGYGTLLDGLACRLGAGEPGSTWVLLPLTREDVSAAARELGLDLDALWLELAGAGPLAARPRTLLLLLDELEANGTLPGSVGALYEEGCRRLAAPAEDRQDRATSPTTDERLDLARAWAARSVLCGVPPPGPATEDRGARATLETGLFDVDGDRTSWSHWSFAEYLASTALRQAGLEGDRLIALLAAPGDRQRRIVPQLQGLAGWLAGTDPGLLAHLLDTEPELLLGADLAELDDLARGDLASALLTRLGTGQLEAHSLGWGRRYRRLRHPGLAEQLRGWLRDTSRPLAAREEAAHMAADTCAEDLAEDLLALGLDGAEPDDLRWSCVVALGAARLSVPERRRLLPLLDGPREVAGAALSLLWPEVLGTAQVLERLRPRGPGGAFGAYEAFMMELEDRLTPDDVPAVLRWHTGVHGDQLFDFMRNSLGRKAVALAWEHVDEPHLAGPLARWVVALQLEDDVVLRDEERARTTTDTTRRRRMIEALLAESPESLDAAFVFVRSGGDDGTWLLDRAAATEGSVRRAYVDLALGLLPRPPLFSDDEAEHRAAAEAWDELAQGLDERGLLDLARDTLRIDLDSDRARRARRSWKREQEWAQRRRKSDEQRRRRTAALLAEVDAHSGPDLWLAFAGRIGDWDPRTDPAWKAATRTQRERVLAAAGAFLDARGPGEGVSDDGRRVTGDAALGLRAVSLLAREDVEAAAARPPEAWQAWAPALVRWGRHPDVVVDALRAHAPTAIAGALEAELDAPDPDPIRLETRLRAVWVDGVGPTALARLEQGRLPAACWHRVLGLLLEHATAGADALARGWLRQDPDRAQAAARALVAAGGRQGLEAFWRAVHEHRDDRERGEALVEAVAAGVRLGSVPVAGLSEKELARSWRWLARQADPREDAWRDGSVGCRERLQEWRGRTLTALARKGTPEASAALRTLVADHADLPWLSHVLADAERRRRALAWTPPHPAELDALLQAPRRHLARTDGELLDACIEALRRFEERLSSDGDLLSMLYDSDGAPRSELKLAAVLRHLLGSEVEGALVRGEVSVNPVRRGGGKRADFEVIVRREGGATVGLVGEVKPADARDVETALSGQLVRKYLARSRFVAGLYLVVAFDARRGAHLGGVLRAECERQQTRGFYVRHYVVVVPPAA